MDPQPVAASSVVELFAGYAPGFVSFALSIVTLWGVIYGPFKKAAEEKEKATADRINAIEAAALARSAESDRRTKALEDARADDRVWRALMERDIKVIGSDIKSAHQKLDEIVFGFRSEGRNGHADRT